jgi:nucleoid-associated protein YgaU
MPANVAQAVLTALASENDPAALRGFASSIMAQYPIAAGVLLAKANTLGTFALGPAAPASPSTTPVVVHLPSGSPTPSIGLRTYRVVGGDSPSRIAKKLTGNDARWPELVAANPQKPKKPDGTFKSLQPGEVLTIPSSWPAVANGAPANAVRA